LEDVTVARLGELQPGDLRLACAGERCYALANVEGTLHAVDNNCPHNGGPLSKGRLIGSTVECPWHGWRWDVTSGRNIWPGVDWRVPRVPVKVEGDAVRLPVL
jgi:nitrite reductase/ring-hydroxylating ferredoxin subunit